MLYDEGNGVEKKEIPKEKVELGEFEELRIEADEEQTCTVTNLMGNCEIFGTEMGNKISYTFKNESISIFSYQGNCLLSIVGKCHHYKQSWKNTLPQSPNMKVLKLHKELETYRRNGKGLKVLIVGRKDSGKTSVSRTLFSYGARMQQRIGYVDLNVELGLISLPCSISCLIANPLIGGYSINNKFNLYSPLLYFFGSTKVSDNEELFQRLVTNLSSKVLLKYKQSKAFQRAGFIVDTGYYGKNTPKMLHYISQAFQIDRIYVIGGGKLHNDIKRNLKDNIGKRKIEVHQLMKSDGVVEKEEDRIKQASNLAIKQYFYGVENTLSPHTCTIKFTEFTLIRIGGAIVAPDSTLPIGTKSIVDKCELYVQKPSLELTNSILAVSNAEKKEDVLEENIVGFIHILKVDVLRGFLRILSPTPKKLEKKFFIMGKLKWIDT